MKIKLVVVLRFNREALLCSRRLTVVLCQSVELRFLRFKRLSVAISARSSYIKESAVTSSDARISLCKCAPGSGSLQFSRHKLEIANIKEYFHFYITSPEEGQQNVLFT